MKLLNWFSVTVLFSVCALGAWGQSTATLSGTVTDPSGSAIPAAHLIVKNEATSLTRQTESDAAGGYVVRELPPGLYSVSVSANGFTAFVQQGIQLTVAQNATLPIRLKIGGQHDIDAAVASANAPAGVDLGAGLQAGIDASVAGLNA